MKRKYNISNRKAYTFRLRMSTNMLNQIEHYSKQLFINKSKFVRIAITKMIAEIESQQ